MDRPRMVRRFAFLHHSRQLHRCDRMPSRRCFATSRLSPSEVTLVLRANEFTQDFNSGPVKSYDSNQLASNQPIEDTRAEARALETNGLLFGIFDGHMGPACAQVLAKRLFKYVAAALMPADRLKELHDTLKDNHCRILEHYNDRYEFVQELKSLYSKSFSSFVAELAASAESAPVQTGDDRTSFALENAFVRLDNDLSREALKDLPGGKTLSVSMSGAVACLAHVSDCHLHVATAGDVQAVLGMLSDGKQWTAKKMSVEHSVDNEKEVQRLLSEHPTSERSTAIQRGRLLGQLAPLRAFGDVRYKWSREQLEESAVPVYGPSVIAPNYFTPPYLTARPDVVYHRLTPRDKFLVIASDGLWDFLSPLQVVRMVGEHMSGKAALSPLRLPSRTKLSDINEILTQRKKTANKVPTDRNAATHLIRNALGGGTDYGSEHSRISELLSLPSAVVRQFRDDITITVIYFDTDYISHQPM